MKYATQTEYWADPVSGKLRNQFEPLYQARILRIHGGVRKNVTL